MQITQLTNSQNEINEQKNKEIKDLTNSENAIYIITIPIKLKNKYKTLIELS